MFQEGKEVLYWEEGGGVGAEGGAEIMRELSWMILRMKTKGF